MKPSCYIEYRGVEVRFCWIDGRYWVPASDLCKALGYSHAVSEPTGLLPRIDAKLNVSDHRRQVPIPRRTWVYDDAGFEFAFWPRLRLFAGRKAELKPLVLEILRKEKQDA